MFGLNNYRIRSLIVGIVVVMILTSGTVTADYAWAQKAEMPIKRIYHSTSVVAGKIYVIGGLCTIGEWNPQWEALTRVDEYDPKTDTWARKADMPTVRAYTSTSVVNDKIYVFGDLGDEFVPIVEVYDPATDTWTEQTLLPTNRWRFTTSVVDGVIYVIGGNDGVSRTGLVEAYDPMTDTWMRKADMPTVKTFTSSCVVDGKIYVIGGAWTREVVEAYDPVTDTWTTKSPMPTPRYGLDTVVVNGKIYAIGGWYHSINGPIYSTVEVYDTVTDTWTKGVDIPVTTAGLSASIVDGKIHVIGGTVATHRGEHWVLTSAVYANEPIVDLNGDGIVDAADMCMLVDNWHTNNMLCDIAPPPLGDGVVDVEDLKILAEHLFEDYRLIAHWKLDEEEGDIAYNSIGDNHGILSGDPTWQLEGGQAAGALEFDGIDDYVETDFVLNPADGAFSVFAWVKGGAPGQVIVSQTDGTGDTWLGIDPLEGTLMTEIGPPAIRTSIPPLISDMVITDNEWHHIGLVWYGTYRALYVDGYKVVEDVIALAPLKSANGGLYIGTNKNLDAGTFFSGLIDDVRIYNIALTTEQIAVQVQ